ncbi:MAG: c-type cytochrome [Candidatus Omnitrophica bacterium]|nr:c-type cytochrome [Candidatus Omnitrophota bacterium]
MMNELLWIALFGAILFTCSGLLTIWAHFKKKDLLRNMGLYAVTLLGPITLGVCWKAQMQLMEADGVIWARLMSGDASIVWAIGSVGLIAGAGLALGALSLLERAKGIYVGALAFALLWVVIFLHPTPHYVPMPAWLDKLIWFALLVGGAAFCLTIYMKYRSYLKLFQLPVIIAAGLFPILALAYPAALVQVSRPLDLSQLPPDQQIKQMGCLSCHSMKGEGYPIPGEGLESVASRKEDVVRAFLADPSAENALKFGIRTNPTGDMAGVRLRDSEVDILTEALKSLFEVQPPSKLGPGWDHVEAILVEKTCLACHTYAGEGAPQGGIGGPLENASAFQEETLVEWLKKPSAENAVALKIRETPMGAMEIFALPEEQAKEAAAWLKSLAQE